MQEDINHRVKTSLKKLFNLNLIAWNGRKVDPIMTKKISSRGSKVAS